MSKIDLDRLERTADRTDAKESLSRLVRAQDGAFGSMTFRDLYESDHFVGKVHSRDGVDYFVLLDWPSHEPLLHKVHLNL
jgi:hypothetical protein